VLDLYSLNEAGPVAVFDARSGGHVLLQDRLYIEILGATGQPLPPGERGEVTLTGGFNFCLPLLRYRTGDHAALRFHGTEPVLVGLEGRPPVRFRTMRGEWLNNIEVTHALQRYAIPRFTLHQDGEGALLLRLAGAEHDEEPIRNSLPRKERAGERRLLRVLPLSPALSPLVPRWERGENLSSLSMTGFLSNIAV
jgi:phenylacetate-CoA ligase